MYWLKVIKTFSKIIKYTLLNLLMIFKEFCDPKGYQEMNDKNVSTKLLKESKIKKQMECVF